MRTNQRTVARGLLVGGGVLAAVLVTACQGAPSAGTGSGSPPSSSLNVASSTANLTVTTSPTSGSNAPAATGGPGATPECKAANLKLTTGPANAAAGHFYVAIDFTNIGSSPCVMQGFPGVSYVSGDNGTQVGQPAVRTGPIGPPVTLAPNAVASSIVTVTDVSVFDASSCKPTPVRGFRVYPPDDTTAMFLPRSGTGCAGNPPSPQLVVQTVKAGAGSA